MEHVFEPPDLGLDDLAVIDDIPAMREALASVLGAPKRSTGSLRRSVRARAIQGSNTIEGYTVTDQDAIAAVDDEPPFTADQRTWAEILGYRRVPTYVIGPPRSIGEPARRDDTDPTVTAAWPTSTS